jgi:ribosomal protein S18 acetylase RimI-like enzyme
MLVRAAQLADLNACYEMDKSYLTDHVWQMHAHGSARSIEARFDLIRLPRPMKVEYPRHPDELLGNWSREECFLVAVDEADTVLGFLDMTAQAWHSTAWIRNLVVHKEHRRRGIGSMLLRSACTWAHERELSGIMAEAQTKNYPAIRFWQKHGFVYCGYNDRYYTNGDIAVFFFLRIKHP